MGRPKAVLTAVNLKIGRRVKSKTVSLDFRRADFNFFKDLLGRILWNNALKRRGAQESSETVQESGPLSSGLVHPDEQYVRQKRQADCIDVQGAHRKEA